MASNGVRLTCLFLVSACIGQLVECQCLNNRLGDPCGGANPVPGTEGQGGTGGTVDGEEALRQIGTSASGATALARTLKMKYNNNSNPSTRIPNIMAEASSAYHLNNFPYYRRSNNTLQSDYDDVVTIAVFMEQVYINEVSSQTDVKYTTEMNDFKTSLYQTLCKIKMAADASNHSLDVNVTCDVIPNYYKDMTSVSTRYLRDYLVFRDSEVYLEALSIAYKH